MKKITAILLAALMVIGCVSVMTATVANAADTTASITIGGTTYSAAVGSKITYTVSLKTQHNVTNGEFYLGYPQSLLSIADDNAVDFPIVTKNNMVYNFTENLADEFRFNFSNQASPYDFTNGGVLVTITFDVIAGGSGNIGFINETSSQPGQLTRETVLSWIDTNYVINDELPNATFTESVSIVEPTTDPTEVTTPTSPTSPTSPTQATEPAPVTKISVKAAKTSIYVGATTTVTATVTNKVGTTTFKSNNTKVATVTSAGKVTGKSAGTVTITATNNGKSASVKIKVIKKAQPMTVKATAKTLKYAAVKKKAQTFKAITVKSAQGTVTYAKKSGNSKITVDKKTGKITVKKGLKKGKYAVKVNVTAAGNTAYVKGTKTATVNITIK